MSNLIQPLKPGEPFTSDKGYLLKNAYDFLFALYRRVGGSLDSLNAATLETFTWEAPGTIGSTTPNTGKFTGLTVTTSIANNGGGLKHKRVTTGSIGAGASATVTVTWGTAFADANYTCSASVLDSTAASASLRIVHLESISASQVVYRVENTSAGSLTGTLHVIAMHD